MRFLCVLPSLLGVFHSLAGEFVSAQVIAFSVMLGSGLMSVGGEKVEFRGSLMCVFHILS
jgi:hypothetical protein